MVHSKCGRRCSMGKFGWSLPPGVTHRMIEEQFGDEGPYMCCGRDPAECICPECPVCHETGNPGCYKPPNTTVDEGGCGLKYHREQLIGQAKMRIAALREQIQDEEMALAYLQTPYEEGNI